MYNVEYTYLKCVLLKTKQKTPKQFKSYLDLTDKHVLYNLSAGGITINISLLGWSQVGYLQAWLNKTKTI